MDWLGMGSSSRPPFTKKRSFHKDYLAPFIKKQQPSMTASTNSTTTTSSIHDVDDFFIDSFQHSIQQLELKEFILLGHSMGGYLSAAYAIKYPNAVSHLILASPVGLPSTDDKLNQMVHDDKTASHAPGLGLRLFRYAWSLNLTPQQIIRYIGRPYGKQTLLSVLQRRFLSMDAQVPVGIHALLAEYLYGITVAKPSGEYALNAILEPRFNAKSKQVGVFARYPLEHRLDAFKKPKLVLFGDRDWLYNKRVDNICETMEETTLKRVSQAGHHLYFDHASEFHEYIVDFVRNSNKKV